MIRKTNPVKLWIKLGEAYKKASIKTAADILAGMKDVKDSLRRRQVLQKKDAANANRAILASVKKDRIS